MDELPFRRVSVNSEMVIHNEKSFQLWILKKTTVGWDYRHFQDYGGNLRRLANISNMFVLGEIFVLGENTKIIFMKQLKIMKVKLELIFCCSESKEITSS